MESKCLHSRASMQIARAMSNILYLWFVFIIIAFSRFCPSQHRSGRNAVKRNGNAGRTVQGDDTSRERWATAVRVNRRRNERLPNLRTFKSADDLGGPRDLSSRELSCPRIEITCSTWTTDRSLQSCPARQRAVIPLNETAFFSDLTRLTHCRSLSHTFFRQRLSDGVAKMWLYAASFAQKFQASNSNSFIF